MNRPTRLRLLSPIIVALVSACAAGNGLAQATGGNPFPLGDASACPNFAPIGNKHLFLSFSHTFGGQYLLGDYNQQSHKFKPYAHGRF